MGGTPFDAQKLADSKSYHMKHIALKPDDPEPYYWVGVIDWSLAYRANKDMRDAFNRTSKKPVKESDPMPPALSTQFSQKYGATIDEGITNLNTAIVKQPRLRRCHGLPEPALPSEGRYGDFRLRT